MDLDLPAPKRPCMHRSSRFVNSAIVTAHSVPRTWPSSSAAKDRAVVLVHAFPIRGMTDITICNSCVVWLRSYIPKQSHRRHA